MSTQTKDDLVRKLYELVEQERKLDEQLDRFRERNVTLALKKRIITLLHSYNDVKDVTLTVLGRLAEIECCPLSELYRKFELPAGDD